jgi:uncharacterized membrane-anchored protein
MHRIQDGLRKQAARVTGRRPAVAAAIVVAVLATAMAGARAADASRDAAADQAWEAAAQAASKGPVDVPLVDQAVLRLPAGEVFVPQPQAERLLAVLGERAPHPDLVGLVLPRDPRATWRLPLRWRRTGLVRDDAPTPWDPEALLQAVRDAAAAASTDRDIVGWTLPPVHDAARHRLAWALATRAGGAPAGSPADVDVEAILLGRDGSLRLNLATTAADASTAQAVVAQHADAIEFVAGKRSTDVVAGSDRTAPTGLVELLVATAVLPSEAAAPRRGFAARHAWPLAGGGAGLLALLAALAGWRLRRRRQRRAAPAFASTIAEGGPGVGDNRGSVSRRVD